MFHANIIWCRYVVGPIGKPINSLSFGIKPLQFYCFITSLNK